MKKKMVTGFIGLNICMFPSDCVPSLSLAGGTCCVSS